MSDVRTVPTIVSAHTFCATRKAWFTHHARARVEIDVINYATKYATEMKAKFSYCDQIKVDEGSWLTSTRNTRIAGYR